MNANSPEATPGPERTAPDAAVAPGRIVLLTTSHRVAPGLLSWPAWQALHAADRVLCADGTHPQLPYLREAGIPVAGRPRPPRSWSTPAPADTRWSWSRPARANRS